MLFSTPEPKAQVHYRHPVLSVVVNFLHFRLLLWNCWTEFNGTWQEPRSQCPLPSLCFFGQSEIQDGHLHLWLAETFLNSSLKPLNRVQQNLTKSKISTSSTKFVFFGPLKKNKMAVLASDRLRCTKKEFNNAISEKPKTLVLPLFSLKAIDPSKRKLFHFISAKRACNPVSYAKFDAYNFQTAIVLFVFLGLILQSYPKLEMVFS